MPSLETYRKPDGSLDHAAYNDAVKRERIERQGKGELCSRCERFIVYAKGYPQICGECKSLGEQGEIHHDSEVRCPKCGKSWEVGNGDDYELYGEGSHDVTCGSCDHEFEITTWVSYTFLSPERIHKSEVSHSALDRMKDGR